MIDDENLWKSIRKDDEKAFTVLFYRYSSKIYSTAYSYIKDSEVCEQIVHDIFLSIWDNRKTVEIKNFKAYLTTASRYRVYKHIAASKIIPINYKEGLEDYQGTLVENTGYYDMAYQDLEEELDNHLEELPKRCREIFVMSRKDLRSNEEIAEKLGISKRSVENQITYALKHLRVSLKDISVLLIIFFKL